MYKRSYEIFGLKHWDEVLRSLFIALPLILIGWLLCYFIWWGKKARARNSGSSGSGSAFIDLFGFLGILIMAVGGFFIIPLFAWIEAMVSGILTIVMAILLVMLIGVGLWSWISGKW